MDFSVESARLGVLHPEFRLDDDDDADEDADEDDDFEDGDEDDEDEEDEDDEEQETWQVRTARGPVDLSGSCLTSDSEPA